jgi:hypothetical protein
MNARVQVQFSLFSLSLIACAMISCGSQQPRLYASMTNEQLSAALIREFPLGSSHRSVTAAAQSLQMEPVSSVKLVHDDGSAVTELPQTPATVNPASLGWQVVDTLDADEHAAYEITAWAPRPIDVGCVLYADTSTRAVLFEFSPEQRLKRMSVSPLIMRGTGAIVQNGFNIRE